VTQAVLAFVEIRATLQMVRQSGGDLLLFVGMNQAFPGSDIGFNLAEIVAEHRCPMAAELDSAAGHAPVPESQLAGFQRQRELLLAFP